MFCFSTIHMHRVQPLNGRISSVTQVSSEEPKGRSLSTGATLQQSVDEPDTHHVISSQQSDSSEPKVPTQVTQGGMFAGVGEFPPTPKTATDCTTQLALHYRPDATLR